MNISEIQVDDFGAWHNLTLKDLSPQATVFYGPNEAGKTTVLNLIRTVLYGFSTARCKKYLPPATGSVAGGLLQVRDVSGSFRIKRSADVHYEGGEGNLSIQSTDGQSRGNHLLATMLSGVDETIFNNVFAVGLTQIQQLVSLSDTEAANQLYGLATGVDRVSLFEVTKILQTQRDEILPPADASYDGTGRIDQLLEQKERLERELKALRRDEGVHAKMRADYRELKAAIAEKENARKQLERTGNWTEISAEVLQNWERCRKLNDRLTRVGPLLDVPKHVAKRVAESLQQVKELRNEWEGISAERKRIKEHAAEFRGRDSLYPHAAEIQALDRQRERITTLEQDVKRAKATVDELEFEISAEMEALGVQIGTKADRLPEISDDVIEALRGPAAETRDLREAAEETRKHAQALRSQAEQVKSDLEAAVVRYGGQDIFAAYRKRAGLVGSLEERLGLDERREGIVRQIEDVEEEASYWHRRSVLPWRGVLAVCGVFSFGAMLVLAGVFHRWFAEIQTKSWIPLVTIGGALSAISLVIKSTLEGSAAERAEHCRQQILTMREDHEQAVEQTEELDAKLRAPGQLDQRLIDAREELLELEQFLPLAERHEALVREADAAEHQATAAVRMLKESRRGWKASLRTVGLPESLTPAQVREMQGRVGDVTRLRRRLADAKREYEDRNQEFETVRERIQQLLTIASVISIPDGLGAQLTKLQSELEKHARSGRELEQLRQRWDQLYEKQQRLSQSAQQIVRKRRELMDAHGIPSMVEFYEAREQTQRCAKMRRERDKRIAKIVELTDDQYTAAQLQSLLDSRPTKLVDLINEFQTNQEVINTDLESLRQRTEGLKEKLHDRMQDRRGDQKELALRCVEEKIQQAIFEWKRSALVSLVLDRVKRTYETKRQPVALAEASTHLERLTEGRYTRVWTPMGQESLCVDDCHGSVLPVEKLSRGTRELVFLALRLALVSSYARRGASMPIVLDDVFVNFDDQRAQAVATVLAEIASAGQQMLIFTCHQRIRSIFHELGHDVRDLPLRQGIQMPKPLVRQDWPAVKLAPLPEVPNEGQRPAVEPQLEEDLDSVTGPESDRGDNDEVGLELPAEEGELDLEPQPMAARVDVKQFTPAWRDEWLTPLPDIAASGDADDE